MAWSGASSGVNAGRGMLFACDYMLGCTDNILPLDCIWCSCAYICWYVVLQKRLVCYCKTIVARTQRGDYSRINLCNWSIDIARPEDSLAPVLGLIYVLGQ